MVANQAKFVFAAVDFDLSHHADVRDAVGDEHGGEEHCCDRCRQRSLRTLAAVGAHYCSQPLLSVQGRGTLLRRCVAQCGAIARGWCGGYSARVCQRPATRAHVPCAGGCKRGEWHERCHRKPLSFASHCAGSGARGAGHPGTVPQLHLI